MVGKERPLVRGCDVRLSDISPLSSLSLVPAILANALKKIVFVVFVAKLRKRSVCPRLLLG
jgi:hypothetical protein